MRRIYSAGKCQDCGHTKPVTEITFWVNGLKYTVCAICIRAYRDRILRILLLVLTVGSFTVGCGEAVLPTSPTAATNCRTVTEPAREETQYVLINGRLVPVIIRIPATTKTVCDPTN